MMRDGALRHYPRRLTYLDPDKAWAIPVAAAQLQVAVWVDEDDTNQIGRVGVWTGSPGDKGEFWRLFEALVE